jgi:hypothetical protein
MLVTIAILLLILWAIGLLSFHSMGGLLHLLLLAAVVVLLIRIIQGRKL